jgi:eukaryotic-like serine/threonine-protein kinase
VHESLIHSWPALRRWLDENQDDAGFLEQLRNAAKQWQAKGFPQGLLWSGEAMEEAKLWRSRYRGELPELQRAFLDAVFSLSVRVTRRKRAAVISAIAFLSLLVIAAGVALVMIRDAQQEATEQARIAQEQLSLTRSAEVIANAERQKADAARQKAVEASENLEAKNTALVAAIDGANRARDEAEAARVDAEEARRKSDKSKRRERRSKRRATDAAQVAQKAEAAAKRAGEDLELLLARERKRVQELEELTKGAQIVPDVDVK